MPNAGCQESIRAFLAHVIHHFGKLLKVHLDKSWNPSFESPIHRQRSWKIHVSTVNRPFLCVAFWECKQKRSKETYEPIRYDQALQQEILQQTLQSIRHLQVSGSFERASFLSNGPSIDPTFPMVKFFIKSSIQRRTCQPNSFWRTHWCRYLEGRAFIDGKQIPGFCTSVTDDLQPKSLRGRLHLQVYDTSYFPFIMMALDLKVSQVRIDGFFCDITRPKLFLILHFLGLQILSRAFHHETWPYLPGPCFPTSTSIS